MRWKSFRPGWLAVWLVLMPTAIMAKAPDYQPAEKLSGRLVSVGSDTMAKLMVYWSDIFKHYHPGVEFSITAKGSATAPPPLIAGESQLGPMSRLMKNEEKAAFEAKHGYEPSYFRVAIDAIGVYVNKDNPLQGLDMYQVDAIFSSTQRCGGTPDIISWGQLGLGGKWSDRAMELYGRNQLSGTYAYFQKKALCKGEYKPSLRQQPGSAEVVKHVGESLNRIGYSGIGYITPQVKALPLAARPGDPFIEATPENAALGEYPLSRFLHIYVNNPPDQPLPPLVREFLRLVLSAQGQKQVIRDGYVALPTDLLYTERRRLEPGRMR